MSVLWQAQTPVVYPVFSAIGWPAMQIPTNIPFDLYNLSQQYGKPIYFETFGDKSDTTGWTDPAGVNATGVVDLQAQYQFYKIVPHWR